ncbi:D-arabinono-1,4-lactone oxidase [Virgisporangium aurantiacum]|uniref:D-arabinono-1,4-lactone oxidase n=1 Tax=Virgisporangium aurantiacum TaxID=175570 RepID=UPI00194F8E87|nr:D-arabinono-1,4-lactone oxidase [Virgisporangium aurantiacum]
MVPNSWREDAELNAARPGDGPAWRNWAGNVSDSAPFVTPESVSELSDTVRTATDRGIRVRVAGSGHSFSPIASSDGMRIALTRMPINVEVVGTSVTVPGGITLNRLNRELDSRGLALPNLGDIDAQTITGAIQTGTHGTGAGFGGLASFVSALTLLTADGSTVSCSRGEPLFDAAVVGLGAFGVVVSVTLECVPAFILRAEERPSPLQPVLDGLDDLIAGNDHFEFYWFPYTSRVQVKLNNRVSELDTPLPGWRRWLDDSFLSNTVFGAGCRVARRVPGFARPLMRVSARALSARTYTATSHEVFCTARRVRFTEMEYGLPRAALGEALKGLRGVVEGLPFPVAFPVEVRFTASDEPWLSHGHGRDSAYVAVHQFVGMPHEPYFREFEKICLDLGGRPHWGKMHFASGERLRAAYPRFADWAAERDRIDPAGVFRSPFVDRLLS